VPGLDSLRAVAFSFVLFDHFVPGDWPWSPWINGHIGVHLFFVISGFLITGILIGSRTALEQTGESAGGVIRRFFARRVLRIFPVFYATLALTYIVGFPVIRETIWWHLTYASNFLFFRRGGFYAEASHFWSLAVEEQFYLAWPFVILLTPRRHLARAMVFCIGFACAFRLAGEFVWGWNEVQREVLTFSCLDSLALGGLFAWWQYGRPARAEGLTRWLLIVALPVWIVLTGIVHYSFPSFGWVARSLDPFALGGVVFAAASGRFAFVLARRPLAYLGRISYGMYVFHLFVPLSVRKILRVVFHLQNLPAPVLVTLYTCVTIAAAAVSWHFFEAPLNSLKRFFPYTRPNTGPLVEVSEGA
jgi:peptidoglycan/LPS O-acetylase OafA/YrhL